MSSSTPQITFSLPDAPSSHPATPDVTPWWGRIELLWLWMAPLCSLLFALTLPLAPNDLWYHVRAGEFISRGSIPTQNLMSNGVPLTADYYYQSWLAELTLFQILKMGGLSGLMVLRGLCVCATILCAVVAAWRGILRLPAPPSRLVAARWSALAGVMGFALASSNIDLRPQTFSAFFFGLWMVCVGEFRAQTGRSRACWGLFIVVLTAVWANTHGAFAVSTAGLVTLALGDAISRHERAKSSFLLLGLCLLAVALNPRGFGLFLYVAQLSNNEIGQRFIQEWKSPGFDGWHNILFWIVGSGIWLWFWLSRRQTKENPVHLGEAVTLALFFIMAARDQRSIIWFALCLIPTLALLGAKQTRATATISVSVPRAAQVLNAFLLAFLLICPLMLFPGVKESWPWPAEFRRRFAPTPTSLFPKDPPLLLENSTPAVAAQWLQDHPPQGLVFTDMVCGSYLTYATFPQIRPWCDPRIELFPVAFWEDYLRLSAGPPQASQELEARGFSDALLDRQSQPALVQRLRQSSRWRPVAQNGSTILFRNLKWNPFKVATLTDS